jgi:signal transduction histidine kinase/CheY-like chemotaxis protein
VEHRQRGVPQQFKPEEVRIILEDIPGVTPEELAAIAELRQNTTFIPYGMTMSTECFRQEYGTTSGFAARVCQWLTDLFGIRFRPVIYEWDRLIRGFAEGTIPLSGEIALALRNNPDWYMTGAIAERRIRLVSRESWEKLVINAQSHGLTYGFLEGSVTESLVRPSLRLDYTSITIANYNDAYQKLMRGEIDCFFIDESMENTFALRGTLLIEDFSPLTYNTVGIAAGNPRMKPIISVVNKYLENAGDYVFQEMYEKGITDYQRFTLDSRLSEPERAYLEERTLSGEPIPVCLEYDYYPVSFYNTREGEWQGIAVDLLRGIGALTGLTFIPANSATAESATLVKLLQNGDAAMVAAMIRSAEWEQKFLVAENSFMTDYYALISAAALRDISLSDVSALTVGLIHESAEEAMFRELFPGHRHIREYENNTAAIQALEDGELDLLMGSRNLLLTITNYREMTGYKANLVLRRPYETVFGFNLKETILWGIVNKAQSLLDTRRVVDSWTRRVFDYSWALAKAQQPFLIAGGILAVMILFLLSVMVHRNHQMAARLEVTVGQRTRELRERTEELEVQTQAARTASQAKGEFLARMSHEIRTPLNAVIGMTEIARRAGTLEKKDRSLEEIDAASNHLLGILNDVLDMSKIESGKFTIAHDAFDLKTAMEEVSHIIIQRCTEKELSFETGFSSLGNYTVLGDKLRLKQVLINLLGNAIKFTSPGGTIRFLVELTEEREAGITARFSVSDSGIGMTPEQCAKLFTAFEQADNSISVRFGGTGLGLAISQNLVKMMGGLIVVESVFGTGSDFSFTLDMETVAPVEKDVEDRTSTQDFTGKRILLVEDIEINRMILVELLADTQVEIEEAADGEKALAAFAEKPPGYYNLIFMDIQMPNMDGYEAAQAIRALDRTDAKTIPIIAMTANAYREDVEHAFQAGMNGHLAKPIEIEAVLATMNHWLGH